jgi:hypothetical protein
VLDVDRLNFFVGIESLFEGATGLDGAECSLNEGAEVAGGAVLGFENDANFPVPLDGGSFAEVVGVDRHK